MTASSGRRVSSSAALLSASASTLLGFLVGALVPSDKASWRGLADASSPPDLSRFSAPMARAAAEFGLDEDLLAGLVATESGGDPHAKSPDGALGLAQLMPSTAAERAKALGMDPSRVDLFDPATNLRLAASVLSLLLDKFGREPAFALAAYNAGAAPVTRWRMRACDASAREAVRREGYAETRHHVSRALAFRDAYASRR